jgi:hypothetical protein
MKITDVTITGHFPAVYRFPDITKEEFVDWYLNQQHVISKKLISVSGIRFEGVQIKELADFEYIMHRVADKFLPYVDGFSPRTKLSSGVYTSTEYDADFDITLHNELSYSYKWPDKIFFCCLSPSATGGETPIADCRDVLRVMDPAIVAKVKATGVRYIRNLHSGTGLGPSWQSTYETTDKSKVEEFCREARINFKWKEDGGLFLEQHHPGIITHPITGEEVWFNQVDQFHPSHLDPEIYEALMLLYNNKPELLPMYGSFGDGEPISLDQVTMIREAVNSCSFKTPWKQGDLLMLDNVLVAHGRKSYTGSRKIVVSMC